MAYTALYRKWRPSTFADVKGQDAIVTTLKNQLRLHRIGHAYLFCGTRGTGKTTVAKILARAVNCEHPTPEGPCGECPACQAIASGASMSVREIDAASNNGVDSIREIREEVQYSPTDAKYRVYIIDEAHMITNQAFNALLKTLEEPPSYVIFILATTDPQKIPVTVLSRCQRYDFKRIPVSVLLERLKELAEGEGVQVQEKALRYIAMKAEGGMRDAISLLDQCIACYPEGEITYDQALEVLGAVDQDVFSRFFLALSEGETENCLHQVDDLVMEGRDLGQFVQDFIWYLRNLLLLRSSEVSSEILNVTEEDAARMRETALHTEAHSLMRLIRLFSELLSQMKTASGKRVLLEIAVLKALEPETESNLESVEERIRRLEEKVKKGLAAAPPQAPVQVVRVPEEEQKEPEVIRLPAADYEDLARLRQEWDGLIASIIKDDPPCGKVLKGTRPEPIRQGTLSIVFFDRENYNRSKAFGALDLLKKKAEAILGREFDVEARVVEESEPEPVYELLTEEDISSVFGTDIPLEEEDQPE